ncbi:hypothetical protein E2C01_072363 [Portunus trituberculatus]|uniref:Uncharacterized protein n=1 Tax=Portunus trituberculatus TaxID=210409 RepID=A0A5B7IB00_PORTR|nr:hypothetical protein [Portunus trituberculatus]
MLEGQEIKHKKETRRRTADQEMKTVRKCRSVGGLILQNLLYVSYAPLTTPSSESTTLQDLRGACLYKPRVSDKGTPLRRPCRHCSTLSP